MVFQPTCLQSFQTEHLIDFTCGDHHTFFTTKSSEDEEVLVYSCGLNTNGQCGVSIKMQPQILEPLRIWLPKSLQKGISDIKAGARHTLFLSGTTGFVYQCGGYQKLEKTEQNKFEKINPNSKGNAQEE